MTVAHDLVLLDRIADELPPYCVHGETFCVLCDKACWLGSATYAVVAEGRALPVCLDCARTHPAFEGRRPAERIEDHLRADGPHA